MEARVCRRNVTLAPLIYLSALPFHPLPAASPPREPRPNTLPWLHFFPLPFLYSHSWGLSHLVPFILFTPLRILSSLSLRTPFVHHRLSVIAVPAAPRPFCPRYPQNYSYLKWDIFFNRKWLRRSSYCPEKTVKSVVTLFQHEHCTFHLFSCILKCNTKR